MGKANEHDVIVIGAGQNGLTVAAYLAKAGLDVVVLEDKKWIGGSTITKEVTAPGFKHDLAAAAVVFGLGSPVITQDELGLLSKHGLKLIYPPIPTLVNLNDDGTSLPIYEDLDQMCDEIAKFSRHDAEAYRKFIDYLLPMVPLMGAGMHNAPPKMGMLFNQLDQTPLGQEFMRLLFMSAKDLAYQWFEHPKMLIHMMNYPTEAMVNPEEGGSAFYVVAMIATQHLPGMHWGIPQGGMQSIPDALARCVKANGGNVLTDHEVVKIKTKGGRVTGVVTANGEEFIARKAVISNVDPRLTLNQWLDNPLEANLRDKINRIADPAFSGLMLQVALDEDPTFKAGGPSKTADSVCMLTTDLTKFRLYFDDLRFGRVPNPDKMVAIIPTRSDPSRAPEGKTVLYLWQFVPYFLSDGGPAKWDSIKEEAGAAALDKFFSYTTNLSTKNVLGKNVISPLDYARNNKNMVNGQILGPAPSLYQYMSFRPVPELGQYRTPVEGLYLSGQSSHPGGGVTFGGRATAQIVMQDLGIDFDDVVS